MFISITKKQSTKREKKNVYLVICQKNQHSPWNCERSTSDQLTLLAIRQLSFSISRVAYQSFETPIKIILTILWILDSESLKYTVREDNELTLFLTLAHPHPVLQTNSHPLYHVLGQPAETGRKASKLSSCTCKLSNLVTALYNCTVQKKWPGRTSHTSQYFLPCKSSFSCLVVTIRDIFSIT